MPASWVIADADDLFAGFDEEVGRVDEEVRGVTHDEQGFALGGDGVVAVAEEADVVAVADEEGGLFVFGFDAVEGDIACAPDLRVRIAEGVLGSGERSPAALEWQGHLIHLFARRL